MLLLENLTSRKVWTPLGYSGSCRSDSDELSGHSLHFTMLSGLPHRAKHCVCGKNITTNISHSTTQPLLEKGTGSQLSQNACLSNKVTWMRWTTQISNHSSLPLFLVAGVLRVCHLQAPAPGTVLGRHFVNWPYPGFVLFPLLLYSPFSLIFFFTNFLVAILIFVSHFVLFLE